MRKFLIASHGRLASGMKSSLDILLGNSKNVTVLDAYVDESNVEQKIAEFFDSLQPQDQPILLSDLYGGSVNQILYRYLDRKPEPFLVAGVNLALVLELTADCETPLTREQLCSTIEMSREMLTLVEIDQSEEPEQSEEFF